MTARPVRPAELLSRPAAQSVRLIALTYLDEAVAALGRLADPEDQEALHDFRVALRRLRTTLRAYRPQLAGSVPRRLRRRLRDVADDTNEARDGEVALAWLRPLEPGFSARERVGLRWLIERIERGQDKDLPKVLAEVRRSFARVERKLRRGLEMYHRPVAAQGRAHEERFWSVASAVLQDQAQRLEGILATIESRDDDAIHRARIAAKRLRYTLEPVAAALPAGARLIPRLKQLQDLLGELHDLSELEDEVRVAMEAAAVARAGRIWELTLDDEAESPALLAAQRRRQNPGLFAVAQRSRARREMLYRQLRADWLERGDEWTQALAAALRDPLPAPAPLGGGSPRRVHRARSV